MQKRFIYFISASAIYMAVLLRIDCDGAAKIGRTKKYIVRCAVYLHAAQVNEARIDRRGNRHLLPDHRPDIGSRNSRRRHVGVRSCVVTTKCRPIRGGSSRHRGRPAAACGRGSSLLRYCQRGRQKQD